MKPLTTILIIAATTLTQCHGAKFWSDLTNIWFGVPLSLTLEACACWIWYYTNKISPATIGISIILLAAPLLNISAPLFRANEQATHNEQARITSIALLRDEIEEIKKDKANARTRSGIREGWKPGIDDGATKLEAKYTKLHELENAKQIAPPALPYLKILMISAAYIALWYITIIAIRKLANEREQPANTESITQRIAQAIDSELERLEITQDAWCKQVKLKPSIVSAVKNNDKNKTNGGRQASHAAIQQVGQAVGITA